MVGLAIGESLATDEHGFSRIVFDGLRASPLSDPCSSVFHPWLVYSAPNGSGVVVEVDLIRRIACDAFSPR
jgi:hypothetical protein